MYILPKLQCINRGGCHMVAKNSKVPKFRNFGVLTGFGVSPGNPVPAQAPARCSEPLMFETLVSNSIKEIE